MTFTTPNARASYPGDGIQTAFPTTFEFIEDDHVRVILRDAGDVETVWVLGVDYTLAGAKVETGGTLTATVAPATGETLVIILDVPFTQEKSLPLGGPFPSVQVEEGLDLAVQGLAKLNAAGGLTIRVPESDKVVNEDLVLPIDEDRKNLFFSFDNQGKPTVSVGTDGNLSPTSAYMDTVLTSADSASARASFEAPGTEVDNTFNGINTFTKIQKWAQGVDVASAATLTLGDDGNTFTVTGTATITSIATKGIGTIVILVAGGAWSLTHDPADLVLPGGVDITAAAGDVFLFEEYATGDWRLIGRLLGSESLEAALPPGHKQGLELSNNTLDPTNDVDIAPGSARDGADTANMKLTSTLTKQLDVAWAEGNDQGGLFTGTKQPDTWYDVFLIKKDVGGTIDVGFDTSPTAANRPAGWTAFLLIGSVLTDSTAAPNSVIQPFFQWRNRFYWVAHTLDLNDGTPSTSEALVTVSVPINRKVRWLGAAVFERGGVTTTEIRSPDEDDNVPSRKDLGTRSSGNHSNTQVERITNDSAQIAYRSSINTADLFQLYTLGWEENF